MGKKDPLIDAYIKKSQEFARPILNHIRELVHEGCPEVEETMKWSFPHFNYKGILCSMASFKSHCAFGFWKGSLLKNLPDSAEKTGDTSMGQFGRITSKSDLPSDKILLNLIREAKKLNDEGISRAKPKSQGKNELEVPGYFLDALKKNKKALGTFEKFSYTHKKDYVDWITEAKTETTRNERLNTAVEWMAEGKIRNWKYLRN